MEFNSQICTTKEQSERLLALGLKKETADYYYYAEQRWNGNDFENTGELIMSPKFNQDEKDHYVYLLETFGDEIGENDTPYVIPAWSLHRLIMMMPSAVYQGDSIRYFMIEQGHNVGYWYFGEDECELCKVWSRKDLYNNIIDSIEWLIKEGYFNKEYLERI